MFSCLTRTVRVSCGYNDFRKRLMRDIRLSQGFCCRLKACGMLRPIVQRLVPDVSEDRNASISRDPVDEDTGRPGALYRLPHNLHLHGQLNHISPLNFLGSSPSTKPLTGPEFMSRRYRGYRA